MVGLTSARDALGQLDGGRVFDLILCDIMMSDMSGIDFHRALAIQAPDTAAQVVFMTGGAFTPSARTFLQTIPNRCVEKPIDRETIDELVRERLGENAKALG